MKKLLALVMAAAMTFSLTACGGQKESSDAASEQDKPTIVYLAEVPASAEEQKAWEEVAADFEKESGIHVELRFQGTWAEIPQALQTAKMSGEQIDLVKVGIGTIRSTLGPAKAVMDMTDLMADYTNRFPEGVLDSCYIGGHLWAFPYADASCTTCLYNKTMFDELGLQPPTTMEEWVAVSEKITAEKGIMPMIFHGKDGWSWPMLYFDTFAQASGNDSIAQVESFLQGSTKFTGDAQKQGFVLIKDLFDKGIMTSASFDTDADGMIATFAQQKAAMMFCGTWDYDSVKAASDFEVAAFEFPLMVEGARREHAFGVGDGAISIPSFANQNNIKNSMKFVEYLLRPEVAHKLLTVNTPKFEVVKGAMAEGDAVTEYLNQHVVPNSVMFLDWIWPSEVNDAFSQTIPAVASGNMTPEEAVEVVQAAYDTAVAEKEYTYDWWNAWTDEDWAKVTPQLPE